ncbi:FAD-dependent oxidoreductase [Isoptericola croceus]|uniref:FAD-dependent oxidoreductase n=1 Tax=Isoptericola croceus TaxID=3031406 RepID=UPI0023F8504C|nr:FAD-dependent oxidoreductase [Isoptericola croceus]
METTTQHPVVVIGAGPVGLAAAAHLLERGIEPLVLEAGAGPGSAVAHWGHVRLFSPWRYCLDAAARRLLEGAGTWSKPNLDALPTGSDLVRDYLAPLAATPALQHRVRYGTRVTAVARDGADRTRSLGRERRAWLVRTESDGGTHDLRAAAVIDASGTYGQPNPLGSSGLPAVGEAEAVPFLAGPLPDVLGRDRELFAGRRTLVVGMGHSAANTLLALTQLAEEVPGTEVVWAIRGGSPRRLFGGGTDDELPARGLLGTRLREAVEAGRLELWTRVAIERLAPVDGRVRVTGVGRAPQARAEGPFEAFVDVVSGATGFRPDLDMLREVRLDLDDVVEAPARLAPLIDPNLHSCGTVSPHGESVLAHPDEGFYLVGMKSYGRAPTFLLATGYEQVRSVAAALAGDRAAADAVELELPETGVCSTDLGGDAEGSACCGGSSEPQLVTLGVGRSLKDRS